MILNMYDSKDDSLVSKLKKSRGIKLIRKYLPNVDANKQGYIVNTLDEWREIKTKFPDIVTCRTDSRVDDSENVNVHGATRKKDDIDNYIIDVSKSVKNPYFICLELEEGSNERIYTKGGFMLDFNIGEDVKIGYVGPGFDCGELTKGLAEHESWVIPWDKNNIKRKDACERFRKGKIIQKAYTDTAIARMAFLIKEYPYRKQEIMDVFPKKYSGVDPKLFAELQENVLIPMWESQEQLISDGLKHCGMEINVVGDNRLVPFEIETPEIFKASSKNDEKYYRDHKEPSKQVANSQSTNIEDELRYGKAKGIVMLQKYLPTQNPFHGLKIVRSLEEWNKIKDSYPDRVTTRTDTIIGAPRNVRIEGTSGKKEDIPKYFDEIKRQNPDSALLILESDIPTIPRYENEGGFNVGFFCGDSVVIELVGKGFDARELTREKAVHERYIIPWQQVLFMRNKKDMMKSLAVSKYTVSDEEYKRTRSERIAYLNSAEDDKETIEQVVPQEFTPIKESVVDGILEDIVFPLYTRQNDLIRDGLKNCNVQGNIVNGRAIPWEIFSPERLAAREVHDREDR